MSLFYAYAIDPTSTTSYRYIITFASRDVADEWWRVVSESDPVKYGGIKRITPQLYTYLPAASPYVYIYSTITDTSCAAKFADRVLFAKVPERDSPTLSAIPPLQITDRVSGQTYFIRSQRVPNTFWWANEKGQIFASSANATKFRITIKNEKNPKIMIGTDDVNITLAFQKCACKAGENSVGVDSKDGGLVLGTSASLFKFSDFKDGFELYGITDRNATSNYASMVVKTDLGEAWELV